MDLKIKERVECLKITLYPSQLKKLASMAKKHRMSRSEVIRRAIESFWDGLKK